MKLPQKCMKLPQKCMKLPQKRVEGNRVIPSFSFTPLGLFQHILGLFPLHV